MWCPGEQAFLADENLLDFLLRDDVPCPEILREENTVLENSDLPELELLDKDVDDFINSMLNSVEDKPSMLQDYLLPTSDSSISEYQHTSPGPGSAFVSGRQSSDIVQVDHNYSLHQDCLEMENMRSEIAKGHVFTDLGTWMDLEDGSEALELNSVFPVAVDANPQLVPGATVQPDYPGPSEEVKQLLLKEGTSLPACQPLMNVNPHCSSSLPSGPGPMECFSQSRGSKIQEGALAEGRRVKTARGKSQNKQAAQESHRKKRSYVEDLEHRMAACMAQNHRLEKKVQVLQKQNMSLYKQVQRLQALVRQSKAETAPAESCSTVTVLSFYFTVSPSAPSSERQKTQVKIRVLSRQMRQFPIQAAPEEQETMVEGYSLQPHNLLQLGTLSQP